MRMHCWVGGRLASVAGGFPRFVHGTAWSQATLKRLSPLRQLRRQVFDLSPEVRDDSLMRLGRRVVCKMHDLGRRRVELAAPKA